MARFDSKQRTRILDAAIRVFAQHGVDGATIRMVGDAAGFNSALLYYYFDNKQTLYVEAVRQVVLDLLAELERRLQPFTGGRDRIRFLVNGVFDYYTAHPERMKLMGTVHTQHAETLGRVIQDVFREQAPAPLRVLREGIESGQLRRVHPAQIWWTILGTCVFTWHMQQTLKFVDPKAFPLPLPTLEEGRDELISILCDGLAAGRSRAGAKPRKSRK